MEAGGERGQMQEMGRRLPGFAVRSSWYWEKENTLNRISNRKTQEVSTCQKAGAICAHQVSVSCCKLKWDQDLSEIVPIILWSKNFSADKTPEDITTFLIMYAY